jgi:hypothetical protein
MLNSSFVYFVNWLPSGSIMFSISFALFIRSLTIVAIISTRTAHSHVNVNTWNDHLPLTDDPVIDFEALGGIAGNDSLSTC